MLRFDLPSIKTQAKKLANGMFILLRNYAAAGAAKGDNNELEIMFIYYIALSNFPLLLN